MNKFIRLLSFEMNRFLKFLIPTLLITAGIQMFVTISKSLSYNKGLEKLIATGESTEYIEMFSIQNVTSSGIYELSIIMIIAIFMIYSFFTWYREWLGKNTFIYRLLMLPMNRSTILFTKSAVFLIGGLLAFVFQFGMYFLQLQLTERLVTSSHYMPLNIHNAQPVYGMIQTLLFPTTFFEFVSNYSFAFGALFTLFAAILIERSFGMKGLVSGVVYFIGYFIVFGLLEGILHTTNMFTTLRPSHIKLILLSYQFIMIGIGILVSNFLLKNKVKV